MPTLEALTNAFITLFVTVDPIGNAPLYLVKFAQTAEKLQ